jgi:PST family polysaccharide transporter
VLQSEQLGKKVAHGAGYTFLGIFFRTLFTFGSVAVLARLLTPADFGYIAMATILTAFASIFSDFGFSAILIQRRVITRLQMDTVFWASLFVGVALASVVFILSFFASWLFSQPIAAELLRVLCITFIVEGLSVVHGGLISRLMRFDLDFWIQLTPIVVRAGVAIILAWYDFGVWSLAYAAIVGSLSRTLFYMSFIPYRPRLRFDRNYLRSTWKTNASYFGGGFLFYINSYIDLLIVGRFLGATVLGYYQNARSLTDEVRSRIAIPLQRILFPAFSTLQDDLPKLQYSIQKSARLLSAIIFPIGIGISSVADDIVPLLYGEQWLAMIPALKFLGLSVAIRGSTAISTSIFNSQNKVGLALRYNIVGSIISVVLISIAATQGLDAVSMAVAAASLYALIMFKIALNLVKLGWRTMLSIMAPSTIASFFMWMTIELSRSSITNEWFATKSSVLFWHIFIGILTYTSLAIALSPLLLKDVKSIFGKFRRQNH